MFQILFRNNNNAPNKDLINFIDNNLINILNCNYTLNLLIVDENKIQNLIDNGITELPSMKYNEDICLGVTDIINYIKRMCERTPKKINDENLDEYVKDFMNKSLDLGDEDPEDAEKNVHKKVSEFQNRKENLGKGKDNTTDNVDDKKIKNTKLNQPQNRGPSREDKNIKNTKPVDTQDRLEIDMNKSVSKNDDIDDDDIRKWMME